MSTEDAINNQMSAVASKIGWAQDATELLAADRLLQFSEPLWIALGHEEGVHRLKRRVLAIAKAFLAGEEAWLSGLRKNDKTRHSTEKEITRLKYIIASLSCTQ